MNDEQARWWTLAQKWSLHPITVVGCLALGGLLGTWRPETGVQLAMVGKVYVNLLTMIVLPFLVSSVIFSLQRLFHDGGSGRIMGRLAAVFILGTAMAAALGAATSMALAPVAGVTEETRSALGGIVGGDADRANTEMPLVAPDEAVDSVSLERILLGLVPSNVFAALVDGQMLQTLVFAMLFGIAAGQVPQRISASLNETLETIYRSCQTLARWINIPLPLVLFSLAASQIAKTGWDPIVAMGRFVLSFGVIALMLFVLSLWIISRRSDRPFGEVLDALREGIALAIATNNIAVCMPAMIEAMAERLSFMRTRVELLVPLAASLFRAGAVVYFIAATLFIAQIYDRNLTGMEILLVAVVAWLTGFATAGMSGIVTVTMVGTICTQLNLPFEAAFVLFVAVDPVCTMLRTTLNMATSCAAISVICPKPLRLS